MSEKIKNNGTIRRGIYLNEVIFRTLPSNGFKIGMFKMLQEVKVQIRL